MLASAMLRILAANDSKASQTLRQLSQRGEHDLARVEPQVRAILQDVQERGDAAVLQYIRQFEHRECENLIMRESRWRQKADLVSSEVRQLLEQAAKRVERYHQHQLDPGFSFSEGGIDLGMRVRPVKAAAIYAPGGKASYPSSVIMSAVPARVAGVQRIVLASPDPSAEVLAAAEISGVTEVLDCGGAQAVAALSFGTSSVPRVDTIVGPGNLYVTCAKKLVYGLVHINSLAGPSEILVVMDKAANPAIAAADLLSQAEHDEDAYPLLICTRREQAEAVCRELEARVQYAKTPDIARASLTRNGIAFVVSDLDEAARFASEIASEHLALNVRDPESVADKVEHAGAIFLGEYTPEAAGDYAAGPSHVLPTGGAVRHSSPLGVYDFLVRTSMIKYSAGALQEQRSLLTGLARLEGFEAHARAVEARFPKASQST